MTARGIGRLFALWLGGAVVALATLAVAAALLLQTAPARSWLAAVLSDAASGASGYRVSIGAIEGTVPTDMTIAAVEIADANGVWLDARDVALGWRPAALLGGRLDIERLTAARLMVPRAPMADSEPAPAQSPLEIQLPSLPVEIALRDLSIGELRLGAAVAGKEVAATVSGSAVLGGRPQDARLELEAQRSDGPGRAALLLGQSPADGILTLSAEVEEPAGGLLAGLLDLPGRPALSLRLAGSGPASGWRGRLDAVAADASAGLDLTLALDERVDLAVVGTVDPGGLAGAEIQELLPRPIALDAALGWTPGTALDIGHADLSAPGIVAKLRGRLDQAAQTIDAIAELTTDDPALIARVADPVAARSLQLTARATGGLATPTIDVRGSAMQLGMPGLSAETVALHGRIAPTEDGRRLAVTARFAPTGIVAAGEPALVQLLGDAPAVALDGIVDPRSGDLDVASLDMSGTGLHASGKGRVASLGQDVDLSVALRVDDLSPLGSRAGLPATGRLEADLRVVGDATGPTLAVDLDAKGAGVTLDDPLLAALVGPAPHLVAAATLDGGAVAIDSATLALAGTEIGASGTVGDTLDLALRASAADLALLSQPLDTEFAGALVVDGRITGSAADPTIAARLHGTNVAAAGIALGDPTAEVTATGLAAAPQGEVTVSAAPGGAPLMAATGFRLREDGGVRLDDLALEGNGTRVVGDLSVRPDGLVDGRLSGAAADLSRWQELAGTAMAGSAELQLSLSAERDRQRIIVAATGSDLAVAEAAKAGAWRLDLAVDDALGRPVLEGDLTAEAVTAGGIAFDRLVAAAEGPLAELGWKIDGSGTGDPAVALNANGSLSIDRGGGATIARLTATIGPAEARLARPATVTWGGGTVEIGDVEARIGEGRVTADARIAEDELRVDAAATDLPLAPLLLLAAATEVQGSVSGTARLRGHPGSPTGDVRLTFAELREAGVEPSQAATLSGEIAGRFANGRVDATARLGGAQEIALDAVLSAPLADDGPLDGKVTGAVDLSFVPKLVDLRGDALSGRLDIDLALAGSLGDPRASGRAELTNGAYESATQGTVLRDIAAEIVGDQNSVRLVSLAANDGNGGTMTAQGDARLDAAAGFPLQAEVAVDRLTALRRREATVQTTGRIDLSRNAQGGRIAGKLTVDQAELRIPDRLGTDIVTLEVTEVNLPPGREPHERPATATAAPLELDVAVDVPGRAFLRGRGLDSEWRGSLEIGGTTAAPDITGELNVVRGTLDLLGRNFRFDRGQVRFVGGGEIDPELAFTAQSEAEALNVRADVSGTASSPSFALSSEPPLPQDEILARLLFGTSAGSLTPLQAVQLAQTAATLSGQGGGISMVDRLRESVGLDTLGVEAGDSLSGSSLAIGKYLTDDVFVKMHQGVTPESRRVGVEVRVLPQITVESDIGAQSQGNVGVNWRLDY